MPKNPTKNPAQSKFNPFVKSKKIENLPFRAAEISQTPIQNGSQQNPPRKAAADRERVGRALQSSAKINKRLCGCKVRVGTIDFCLELECLNRVKFHKKIQYPKFHCQKLNLNGATSCWDKKSHKKQQFL
jgi:hypothetical protein